MGLGASGLGIHEEAKILDYDGHAEVVVPDLAVPRKSVEDGFLRRIREEAG